MSTFSHFFGLAGKGNEPYPYQARLAEGPWPDTLVIPTGFGKTAAVLAAWIWRCKQQQRETPRRLVYCLPMRTLVEQTARAAEEWTACAKDMFNLEIGVHLIMGGAEGRNKSGRRDLPEWMLNPEKAAILVGTQDMLVSAALMRGYGASRYRWPVDFALLHNDAMWVFDEVQLAGATVPTSAQLEAFRREFGVARACRTLWMSATLDPFWLRTVDFTPRDGRREHDLAAEDLARAAILWKAKKRLARADIDAASVAKPSELTAYAEAVANLARARTQPGKVTIVFLNTVARAQAVFRALPALDGPERLLLHSRFRPAEREALTDRAMFEAPAQGRIIVTTQALEAGVDISSAAMITELSPWSSLVQRIGRCNRRGECGEAGADVFWIDLPDDAAQPYSPEDFTEARAKLDGLSRCGPEALSAIEPSAPPPSHVIRRRDLLDLFDTEADLFGFDLDVSLYVRDAEDTDVRLFWRDISERERSASGPTREELCPAPIGGVKEFLRRKGVRAWRWDTIDKAWAPIAAAELRPGLVIMIDAVSGGYDSERGFDPRSTDRVEPVEVVENDGGSPEGIDDDPDAAMNARVSLAKHSAHVRDEMERLCDTFGVADAERTKVVEAALWHDLGKAHKVFVALTHHTDAPPPEVVLAKWPPLRPKPLSPRPFFRHELASALGYLAHKNWSEDANLAAYLIAAHHGKIRARIGSLPTERRAPDGRLFARGVWDLDVLPATRLADIPTPELTLDLDIMQLGEGAHGPSWAERVRALLKEYGPFQLAWLETLVRIADWRASRAEEAADHDDL